MRRTGREDNHQKGKKIIHHPIISNLFFLTLKYDNLFFYTVVLFGILYMQSFIISLTNGTNEMIDVLLMYLYTSSPVLFVLGMGYCSEVIMQINKFSVCWHSSLFPHH